MLPSEFERFPNFTRWELTWEFSCRILFCSTWDSSCYCCWSYNFWIVSFPLIWLRLIFPGRIGRFCLPVCGLCERDRFWDPRMITGSARRFWGLLGTTFWVE